MPKRILLISLLTALFVQTHYAQDNGYYGGSGHFQMGTAFFDYSAVNSYMRSRQLPAFAATSVHIGGGGFGVINNFLIGGEGGMFSASSVSNKNGEASTGAGFGLINMGYVLKSPDKFLFYPVIGFGVGGSNLNIKYADGTKETFEAGKFFFTTELNVDLFAFSADAGTQKYGFKTGLTIGYLFNPQTEPWQQKGAKTSEVANQFLNGPYIKIRLGGGGIGLKKEAEK